MLKKVADFTIPKVMRGFSIQNPTYNKSIEYHNKIQEYVNKNPGLHRDLQPLLNEHGEYLEALAQQEQREYLQAPAQQVKNSHGQGEGGGEKNQQKQWWERLLNSHTAQLTTAIGFALVGYNNILAKRSEDLKLRYEKLMLKNKKLEDKELKNQEWEVDLSRTNKYISAYQNANDLLKIVCITSVFKTGEKLNELEARLALIELQSIKDKKGLEGENFEITSLIGMLEKYLEMKKAENPKDEHGENLLKRNLKEIQEKYGFSEEKEMLGQIIGELKKIKINDVDAHGMVMKITNFYKERLENVKSFEENMNMINNNPRLGLDTDDTNK